MKLSATNSINFKGYDAVPLKNLYMLNYSTPSQKDIMEDLQEIGKKEGFGVYLEQEDKLYDKLGYFQAGITQYKWSQDNKMIINNGSETGVLLPNNTSSKYNNLGQILGIHTKAAKTIFDGGNVFLGKKDDGENFLIIGETVLNATSANNVEYYTSAYHTTTVNFNDTFDPIDVTLVGYTFRGWSETDAANATVLTGTTVTLSASKTYYASYQTTVTATFTANELTFSDKTLSTGTYGTAYTSTAFSAFFPLCIFHNFLRDFQYICQVAFAHRT